MVASTIPNRVTDDWAEAAPAAAITANAMRDFFMQVSPRLNIGLRCEWEIGMQARSCSHRIPGPTSFWKVVAIAPDDPLVRKDFSPKRTVSLHMDNKVGM